MNLSWIGRNRSLELSPRARLVDDVDAEFLLRKREALAWRPQNGFLKDERDVRLDSDVPAACAACGRDSAPIAPAAPRHHRMLDPPRLVHEVRERQPRMPQHHARPRIPHDVARQFARLWLVAVDRAPGAGGFLGPVRTFLQPALRVIQEPLAVRA